MGRNAAKFCIIMIVNAISTMAQNLSFGADNFYKSDNVTVQPITFTNLYQMTVSANLFIPNGLDRSVNSSAIIVGPPMGAVKEQSANLYATKLAEQGFIAVSVDAAFWGGSAGEPRNAVLPDVYAETFSAAVDYLTLQDFVDRERIGVLGICGSGGFVISAAKLDPRMKAIATASMYDMGAVNRNGLQHAISIEQRKENTAAAIAQRQIEVDGGETAYTGGTPPVLTNDSTPIDVEFFDFYRTPRGEFTPEGTTPNLTTHPTLSSNTKFLNFYPFNDISTISPRPMLFIAGDQAHSREFSEDAYALAGEPKELVWIPGAGHADLYDRTELIPFAKLTQFFRQHLSEANVTRNSY
ncbi:hydrolase of the alpha/beta superfamily [Lophiostoma macrostomum CBS 122681]|uniref:Hydrolase of the alpha/beta superfamily n=1 Tax=Lophiostoma macrostomum CBS 122681 TaxID=1314788 RepID=A0A6A6SUT0_9PLEO|nr:hydrolase of the alpha/beta superfamily [Lophiostoma macrostomum CBS 122681]